MNGLSLDQLNRDIYAVIEASIKKGLAGLRVALPATVTKFDLEKQTVSVVPNLKELVQEDSKMEFVELPELQEVPICIPHNNEYCLTLPIKEGDECMVVFQDLCIDSWWAKGGIQDWNDYRRHDLSDAIAVFSPFSQVNTIPSYNTSRAEFRNNDGTLKIGLSNSDSTIYVDGNEDHTGDEKHTGELQRIGNSQLMGNLDVTGNTQLTGTLTVTGVTQVQNNVTVIGQTDSMTYSTNGVLGVTGSFKDLNNNTIVVTNGLITSIG